ncbi:hypothetical protein A2242_00870 [Candidatus Falkowbacteria bacterium RIFOXYA2_FULL_47_9]|uniref:Dihydroorotate dehydrogenase catalytic domain-containing protein n=1 Tax=Candidatus Falkowbacteria bacterium RIFOXYA2_FULL_47_9 TaxID=1797995 RepID=A0A1F5SQU4_9BACT|nr:MAG: hypothetical protein A2242_00870 [Candidatus Falkowbacteria bacterium RIFOXYA2_FULL_47_9]
MLHQPFYDPAKSYEENFQSGPFGAFADGVVIEDSGEPSHEFLGVKLHSLFGIPAGPLLNSRFVKAALRKGFDIATYKTVRTTACPCHAWPNVLAVKLDGDLTLQKAQIPLAADQNYCEPLSITNSFGVPSREPDFWQPDLADAVAAAECGQVVVGSFQGTATGGNEQDYVNDFAHAARLVKETGCKILEVNLSCPNEGAANLLCFDIARAQKVVSAIKNEIGNTPLIIKIAYIADDALLTQLVRAVEKTADAIEAINTIPAAIVNQSGQPALPGQNRLRSGVCGSGIKWAGLAMAAKLKALRGDLYARYTIIGVGGVMNAGDYQDYRKAGADAVLSATGAMWNPYLAQDIKNY